MGALPGLMFIIDINKEQLAISEAQKLGIPSVAIVDTNCDPDSVSHPIAGNDDAIRSIEIITHHMADAVIEGRAASGKSEGPAGDKDGDDKPEAPAEVAAAN